MAKPILILQMLRMGDIILSFPLFTWLAKTFPEHPVWVVAEPGFFNELLPISPQVTYFPWSESQKLLSSSYHCVMNLSHRKEAACLSGRLNAEFKIGPEQREGSGLYIHGKWQLYRSSLVGNNRHNRYHWADLNALDLVDIRLMARTQWPSPRTLPGDNRKIALFLGASEKNKRPDAAFWSELVRELVRRDMRPVLLGGPGDRALSDDVVAGSGEPVLNLTGKMGLSTLCRTGQAFQIMVTPDTGPMHLAGWCATKVLNLSMGPVNPWETGPYHPGHYVLQSTISCRGCWQCDFSSSPCKNNLDAQKTAVLIKRLIKNDSSDFRHFPLTGYSLLKSTRNRNGLYDLKAVHSRKSLREDLGRFWQGVWNETFGLEESSSLPETWQRMQNRYPRLSGRFPVELVNFSRKMKLLVAGKEDPSDEFWKSHPPFLRPLTGYAQHYLQNNDCSDKSVRFVLNILQRLISLTG